MSQLPSHRPPKWPLQFLRLFLKDTYLEEIEGDLEELFEEDLYQHAAKQARRKYAWQVLTLLRPNLIKHMRYIPEFTLLSHHFKITQRQLKKEKLYSFLNIFGLSIGIATTLLIGLWIWDALTFNRDNEHIDRVAKVVQIRQKGNRKRVWRSTMAPLAKELAHSYGSHFEYVVLASFPHTSYFSYGEKELKRKGLFIEADGPKLLDIHLLEGDVSDLNEPNVVFLSQSTAKELFGDQHPINQTISINNKASVKVTGVYEDFPSNSSFNEILYLASFQTSVSINLYSNHMLNVWWATSFQLLVQIKSGEEMEQVSKHIKSIILDNTPHNPFNASDKPEAYLFPMNRWHLYSKFVNGKSVGGRIQYIWLLSIIGLFILMLACFNYINLSTARSEERLREIGIRKAIGASKKQLIGQFFTEAFLFTVISFGLSLILAVGFLPWFNEVANKQLTIPWNNLFFWGMGLGLIGMISIGSGLYPAFYLSAFHPIHALKKKVSINPFSMYAREFLVVIQFATSVILIIGTIVVYQQIHYAQERPLGYKQNRLLTIDVSLENIGPHFPILRNELLTQRAVEEIALSSSPITSFTENSLDITWEGKDPNVNLGIANTSVSHEYGKAIGWNIIAGRDFDPQFSTDSSAFIISKAMVEMIDFTDPVGKILRWDERMYHIIGVVENMVVESPYYRARPSIYRLDVTVGNVLNVKLSPHVNASEAIALLEQTLKKIIPHSQYEIAFADEEFEKKFQEEQRVARLSSVFSILAILLSCMGMFGLASFLAARKTKEIGIRKVLGASVTHIIYLLVQNFFTLVMIAIIIAIPIGWYLSSEWLSNFAYRTELHSWIYILTGLITLAISLLSVGFQSVTAALANPITSLRNNE